MARTLCPVVVGRDPELQALDTALSALGDGSGTCLVVTGEAGIGKSRLARELAGRAKRVPVVIGRAVPSGTSEPYRPLTEALLQLLRDGHTPAASVNQWRAALAPVLPHLAEVEGQAGGQGVSAPVRADAVLQLLRRASPAGVVVVLEDLHWADPDTVSVVEYMADHVAGEPLILAITSRDEPGSAFAAVARRMWGRTGVVHLPLSRLTPAQTAQMAAECLAAAGSGGPEERDLTRLQQSAEGIPLLVEELLASPGLPESVAETVVTRLVGMAPEHRRVLETAAALGRQFDWELLPAASGLHPDVVGAALAAGVDSQLLTLDGDAFRFRHALTREAVLGAMLPPHRKAVAAAALAALPPDRLEEVAADLAVQAGQGARAGALLRATGRRALERGAIDTAIQTLHRAVELLEGTSDLAGAELALVEALALAGRVDEANQVGRRLIARNGESPERDGVRLQAHLQLARAAVSAARWPLASRHLEAASQLAGPATPGETAARMALLFSEVELAGGHPDEAVTRAEEALARADAAAPEVRCHAFEILGRSCRLRDLAGARALFEQGLAVADAAGLPHWRLRALQEVGTIDMFDHVGVDRLLEARTLAEQAGAVTTAASLDLQLGACFTARWELDRAEEHVQSALERAERFRLEVVQAKALISLSACVSMRGDVEGADSYARLARAVAPDDQWLHGFGFISHGMARITSGDFAGAVRPFGEGTAIMNRVPHGEPASARAVWPLLLARQGDRRAASAVDETRRSGVGAFKLNQGLLAYAEAVIAGREGDTARAERIVSAADAGFTNCGPWLDLARLLAAESAIQHGWGDPVGWMAAAAAGFGRLGLESLAAHAAKLASPNPWPAAGITGREAEVLKLLAQGRANKEIASELGLSVRTVEKHVESLLRKTGTRSRTELAVGAAGT